MGHEVVHSWWVRAGAKICVSSPTKRWVKFEKCRLSLGAGFLARRGLEHSPSKVGGTGSKFEGLAACEEETEEPRWEGLRGGTQSSMPQRLLSGQRTGKDRLRQRNARRKQPKKYYSETVHADGQRSWSGGRDLADSAAYPAWFCKAIFKCWAEQYKANGLPNIAAVVPDENNTNEEPTEQSEAPEANLDKGKSSDAPEANLDKGKSSDALEANLDKGKSSDAPQANLDKGKSSEHPVDEAVLTTGKNFETMVVTQPTNFAQEVVGNQNSTAPEASMTADQNHPPEQHPPTRRRLPPSFGNLSLSEPPLPPPAQTPPESPKDLAKSDLQNIKHEKTPKRSVKREISGQTDPCTPPARVKRDAATPIKRDAQSSVEQRMNLKKVKVEKNNEQNRPAPPSESRSSRVRAMSGPETPPKPCRVSNRDAMWRALEEHIIRGESMFLRQDAGLVLGSLREI
eukprot:s3146_g2.t1